MEQTSKFRLPNSTVEYLTDPVIRKAVDSLLDVGEDALPNSLEVQELSNYYRARAAALAVKYDTVIAMENLFHSIWVGDPEWRCDLNDASQISPDEIFQNLEFWVESKNLKRTFYSGLGLEPHENSSMLYVTLSCSLEDHLRNELLTEQIAPFAFAGKKDDWENWMVHRFPVPFEAQAEWDITQLCRIAADVREKVKERLSKL